MGKSWRDEVEGAVVFLRVYAEVFKAWALREDAGEEEGRCLSRELSIVVSKLYALDAMLKGAKEGAPAGICTRRGERV